MNTRLPRLLASGLFVLMGGLFVAAFLLIRSHYAASLSTVESSFRTILAQQTEILREQITQQEAEAFLLHKMEQELEADLFIVLPDSVVPACTAGLLKTVSRQEADVAIEQGIAALPEPAALPFFEIAAKRRVEIPSDLYKKIASHFNALELSYEVQTVCRIIALINSLETSLTASQTRFFNTLLAEQAPDLEKTRMRNSKLWKTAEAIDQSLTRQKGTYRVVMKGQTLSVRADGLALLYSPEIQTIPSVQLSRTQPTGLHEEITHISHFKNTLYLSDINCASCCGGVY